jgi:hypothetical protein
VTECGPLYRYIEFCRNAETLWRKLESGRWDWLGRKPDGQFVLGRPRRWQDSTVGVLTGHPSAERGAKAGQHGVRVYAWSGQPKTVPNNEHWFTTPEKARERFEIYVRTFKNPKRGPVLARVVLPEHGQVAEEHFIAQLPPANYQ